MLIAMLLCLLSGIFKEYQSSITFFLKKIVLMVAAFRFFLFLFPVCEVAECIVVRLSEYCIAKFVQLRFIILDDFKFKLPVSTKRATNATSPLQAVMPITLAVAYIVGFLIKRLIVIFEPEDRTKC